jgi:hypothetical protein
MASKTRGASRQNKSSVEVRRGRTARGRQHISAKSELRELPLFVGIASKQALDDVQAWKIAGARSRGVSSECHQSIGHDPWPG